MPPFPTFRLFGRRIKYCRIVVRTRWCLHVAQMRAQSSGSVLDYSAKQQLLPLMVRTRVSYRGACNELNNCTEIQRTFYPFA
jgi:hypothetical protein